jgi:hypothetical protein
VKNNLERSGRKPVRRRPQRALLETRFHDPRGPLFEFQVDGGGSATGLFLEQGNPVQRVPLTRVP